MMIDWVNVALNALWILGLSIILAAFSYHQWLAGETASRLRELWLQPSWQIPFSAGMLLTSIGLGYGVAERWWEKVIWTSVAVFYASDLVRIVRRGRHNGHSGPSPAPLASRSSSGASPPHRPMR